MADCRLNQAAYSNRYARMGEIVTHALIGGGAMHDRTSAASNLDGRDTFGSCSTNDGELFGRFLPITNGSQRVKPSSIGAGEA